MKGERNVCSKPERKKKQLMDYLLHGHVAPIDTCSAMHSSVKVIMHSRESRNPTEIERDLDDTLCFFYV